MATCSLLFVARLIAVPLLASPCALDAVPRVNDYWREGRAGLNVARSPEAHLGMSHAHDGGRWNNIPPISLTGAATRNTSATINASGKIMI